MKRIISFIAAVALTFTLVSCGNEEVNTEDWRIVSSFCLNESEKNGAFKLDTYSSLNFVDFSTMEQAPVCDDPTCKHEADECNSYGKSNHPFLYNDKLYYIKQTDIYQENNEMLVDTQLWQSDINGANEKQIAEIKGLVYYDYDRMLVYNGTAYMCMNIYNYDENNNEIEGGVQVLSCNLESGEVTNYGEVLSGYNIGAWVYGLWDNKMIFSISRPAENLPYMERLAKYAEENNLTEDEAFATYDGDFVFEYYQFDIDTGEISECEYPEPQAISPRCYYYLNGDKLMYLDSEGEEHEIEGLEGELRNITPLNDYTVIDVEDTTYLFNEPEQELTKLDGSYYIDGIYEDNVILDIIDNDTGTSSYEKKPISELEA